MVDDEQLNLMVLKKILANWGIASEEAVNGKIALEMCMAKDYQVVLMDINMPVMDGFESSKAIKGIKKRSFHSAMDHRNYRFSRLFDIGNYRVSRHRRLPVKALQVGGTFPKVLSIEYCWFGITANTDSSIFYFKSHLQTFKNTYLSAIYIL